MLIHSLYLYPVKSLAGIPVQRMAIDAFGPAGDRRWMVVDNAGRFVTQRQHPELALIATALNDEDVTLCIPGRGDYCLQAGATRCLVEVWGDQVQALTAQGDVNQALSQFCGLPLRLVFMPDDSFRQIDPSRVPEARRVGFADGFPLLVANLASLDELNSRLAQPVDIRRFRPNIVVEGGAAWSEDHWSELQVDRSRLRIVKPCSRCVMTTVDPDAGEKAPDAEPMKTLSAYRRTADGVIFGQNALHDGTGPLSVGDPVRVLS
jgi:uncharacterized protein YcbX